MQAFLSFCTLAARSLVSGACAAIGVPLGDAVGERVGQFLHERLVNQSSRLLDALRRAEAQSWAVVESLVDEGPSAWQRCKAFLSPADEKDLRSRLEEALIATIQKSGMEPSVFRGRCLRELRSARGTAEDRQFDAGELARGLAAYSDPGVMKAGHFASVVAIAEGFKFGGAKALAALVQWKPDGATSLLAFLSDYFFRRELERDEILYRSLTFSALERIERKLDDMRAKGTEPPQPRPRPLPPFKFSEDELRENTELRLPCVLLVDVSRSMAGEALDSLRHGLEVYRTELLADNLASQRVEVAVVGFGTTPRILCPFVSAERFRPPRLEAGGKTALGAALHHVLDMLEFRKKQYGKHGVASFSPWVFLLTDGAPTDEWASAAERVRGRVRAGTLFFHAVGVEGADFGTLREVAGGPVYRLEGLRFRDLFRWLSQSQRAVSRSSPALERTVPFCDPAAAGDWLRIA